MFYHLIVLLPMFNCLFWTIVLLARVRNNNRAQHVLGVLMLVCCILYITQAVFFERNYNLYIWIDAIYIFCTLCVYPLYFLYVKMMTDPHPLQKCDFCIFLPAFFISAIAAGLYLKLGEENAIAFVKQEIYHELVFEKLNTYQMVLMYTRYLFAFVFLGQLLWSIVYISRRIMAYHKKLKNYFSDLSNKRVGVVYKLLIAFVFISMLYFMYIFYGRDFYFDSKMIFVIFTLLYTILFFSIGLVGYRIRYTVLDFKEQLAKVEMIEELSTNEIENRSEYIEQVTHKLNDLFEHENIFLKKDLKISELALLLGTNRTYASRLVNHIYKMSFSDIVNKYRVESACELLKGDKEVPMDKIANDSGFSSMPSFYRAFKKFTNYSPMTWKNIYSE